VLRLRRTRNGCEDVVFFPPATVAVLREYLGDRTDGPLFQASHRGRLTARSVHRRLSKWAERAGISGRVHPHRLRHTFSTRLFSSTSNVLLAARTCTPHSATVSRPHGVDRAGRVARPRPHVPPLAPTASGHFLTNVPVSPDCSASGGHAVLRAVVVSVRRKNSEQSASRPDATREFKCPRVDAISAN
jgi:hypothetical protein